LLSAASPGLRSFTCRQCRQTERLSLRYRDLRYAKLDRSDLKQAD
jgi:hypothetical protein